MDNSTWTCISQGNVDHAQVSIKYTFNMKKVDMLRKNKTGACSNRVLDLTNFLPLLPQARYTGTP